MMRFAFVVALLVGCGPAGTNGAATSPIDGQTGSPTATGSGGDSHREESPREDSNAGGVSSDTVSSGTGAVDGVSNGTVSADGISSGTVPNGTVPNGTVPNGTVGSTSGSGGAASAGTAAQATPPRPTTILAPSRAGRISTRAVRRVIDAHRSEISVCYEEGLNRNPNLEGLAAVRFLVGPDGRVDDAEVYSSTLRDPQVETCITTAMRSWEFPRPRPRGRSVLLTYPYDLSTAPEE